MLCLVNLNVNDCTFQQFEESVFSLVGGDPICESNLIDYYYSYTVENMININRSKFHSNTNAISNIENNFGYNVTISIVTLNHLVTTVTG